MTFKNINKHTSLLLQSSAMGQTCIIIWIGSTNLMPEINVFFKSVANVKFSKVLTRNKNHHNYFIWLSDSCSILEWNQMNDKSKNKYVQYRNLRRGNK